MELCNNVITVEKEYTPIIAEGEESIRGTKNHFAAEPEGIKNFCWYSSQSGWWKDALCSFHRPSELTERAVNFCVKNNSIVPNFLVKIIFKDLRNYMKNDFFLVFKLLGVSYIMEELNIYIFNKYKTNKN